MYVAGYIYHTGDTDTNIVFSDDTVTINAGGQGFTFKGNGRFGIGTVSPTEKLHVEGNIELINNGYIGSLDGNYWQRIRFEDDTPSSTNAFNFETRNGSGSFINHMTITNNGDVGIGITAPQKALNVFADGTAPVRFERNTSDGQVIQIYKFRNMFTCILYLFTRLSQLKLFADVRSNRDMNTGSPCSHGWFDA